MNSAIAKIQRLDRQMRRVSPGAVPAAGRRQPKAAPAPSKEAAPPRSYLDWYRTTVPDHWLDEHGDPPAHVGYLCDLVQDVIEGRVQRLAVSLPPGHGKSETITRRLPTYWGLRFPEDVVVQTGYSQRFTEKHLSYPTRELARELGVLSSNATALDEWEYSTGARLVARGVGSAPTGVNPIGLLLSDDPIKDRAQASSAVERENVWAWWTGSIIQRFWPRTRALIIATRWHEDDLIGRLRAQEEALPEGERTWTFVNLPALAVEGKAGDPPDPLGREPGEALWPGGKPRAFLEALRREMGEPEFEAVNQGNPTPREGTTFKVDRLGYVDAGEVPEIVSVCRAWDLAATQGAGDYTVGAKVGRGADGLFYVLDVVRGQWESAKRNREMLQAAARDGRAVPVHVPQDPGQAGKDQAASMVRLFAGYDVETETVSGAKETRADPLAAQLNAGADGELGNVRVVRAPWNGAFVEELRQFPAGAHDDQVDATADAFNEVAPPALDFDRVF